MDIYFNKSYIGKNFGGFEVVGILKSDFSGKTIWKLKCNKCEARHCILAYRLLEDGVLSCKCGNSYEFKVDNDNKYGLNSKEKIIEAEDQKCSLQLNYRDKQRIRKIRQVIIGRCYNPKNTSYHLYGGIGVKLEDSWLKDINKFVNWSIDNGYKPWLNIKRKNREGDYNKENCYWGNGKEEQSRENIAPNLDRYREIGINTEMLEDHISKCCIDSGTAINGLEGIYKTLKYSNKDEANISKLIKADIRYIENSIKTVELVRDRLTVYKYINKNSRDTTNKDAIIKLNETINKLIETLSILNRGNKQNK